MYATPTYVAEQLAGAYIRDRIHDAEARRAALAARSARTAARERRYVDVDAKAQPVAPARRWRIFTARTTTA